MSDIDIKKNSQRIRLNPSRIGKRLGVDTKTVQNWEYGSNIPKSKHAILRGLLKNPQMYAGGGDQSNINGDNINGNNVTVNKTDAEKLMDLLKMKEEALVKAQSHIDRLLAIIENLTNK